MNNRNLINPTKLYKNTELLKREIMKDNNKKSGIYRWVNTINGKTYIGSGTDLNRRLSTYFSEKKLNSNSRPIQEALLKYGHSNFNLEILEYCPQSELINREQYYLNLLVPDYNILKYAYSSLGYKHTEETLEKLRSRTLSEEHKKIISSVHTGKVVSEETKNKLSLATSNFKKENPLTPEALLNIKNKTTEREGAPVSVLNTKTNEVKVFSNQTEAGLFLGITRQAVYNALKRDSIIKEIYKIKKS